MRSAWGVVFAALGLAVGVTGGCIQRQVEEADGAGVDAAQEQPQNVLTPEERTAGWRLLFDGVTTAGWRGYQKDHAPAGWTVEDGLLTRVASAGDLITEEKFSDFELVAEWKVGAGGNSGIFYRGSEDEEWLYHTAPEFQVLDDAGHPDGQSPLTSAGSDYGLYAAPRGVVHAAGEWNSARILVVGNRVEHWLNGRKTAEYMLGSEDWAHRVRESKFAQWPRYGTMEIGHIGLQDHGDRVWYRNIKIRVIG
ncbi:MAG: DUF1080 domain-containing protein [Gemmatimonadota bacterium]|nr:DUF1080 domain-containing protein [Gemmatimonadota bacterium]MDH5758483.1 DUF1080 domain-containing protein [Gemmatimonadota bacterium]